LLLNMAFQTSVGKELEIAYGKFRICGIYLIAGIGGNLGSCLFIPTEVEVGCSGALYGLLGCVLIDLFQNWKLLKHIGQNPWWLLFKQMMVITVSLCIGLFPGIDNFAHLGGFIFGTLAGVVFLPTINFGKWSAIWKLILVISAFCTIVVLFSVGLNQFDLEKGSDWCPTCREVDCLSALFNCKGLNPNPDSSPDKDGDQSGSGN